MFHSGVPIGSLRLFPFSSERNHPTIVRGSTFYEQSTSALTTSSSKSSCYAAFPPIADITSAQCASATGDSNSAPRVRTDHKKFRQHVVNCKARRHDAGSSAAGGGHDYHSRTDGRGPGVSPRRANGSPVSLDGRGFN